ncbi:MAG: VanZ family protein [Bacillota bacterium]
MLAYLRSAASMLPLAAIAGAVVYFPLFLYRRKRSPGFSPLRHLLGYLFCAYAGMVLLVVFLWHPGLSQRLLNLYPFMDIIGAYAGGGSMLSSQFMLNIAMFLPLGLFLPFAFPRRGNRAYKVALIALCATLAIEITQYFLGRAADIDDVIANTLGGVAGFAVYVLLQRAFSGKPWSGKVFGGEHIATRRRVMASATLLLLLILLPVTLDAADQNSDYGLVRYCAIRLPRNLALGVTLPDTAATRTVYQVRTADMHEEASRIVSAFHLEGEYNESRMGELLYVNHRDWFLVFKEQGTWNLQIPDGLNFEQFLETQGAQSPEGAAQSIAGMFLREGETISSVTRLDGDAETVFKLTVQGGSDYTDGAIDIGLSGDAVRWISFNVIRAQQRGQVEVISAEDAVRAATLYGEYDAEFSDATLTGFSEDYVVHEGLVLPAYRLSGTATRGGETIQWESLVDSVRR